VARADRPEPAHPSVKRKDALSEGSSRAPAASKATESVSGEDARAAIPLEASGSTVGAVSASAPEREPIAELVHQLRSPLNAALLWVRLVRSGGLEPHSTERALETIEQNLCILNESLNDLVAEGESDGAVR